MPALLFPGRASITIHSAMCVIDNWLSIELRFCPQSQIQGRQRANLDIEASVHVYLGIQRYRIQILIPRGRDVRDLVSAALA